MRVRTVVEISERLNAALAGRYAIERELGRGGMATVFLAQDLRHSRPVAIKLLSPELAAAVGPERFLREIEIAARLQHPHILPLLDSGSAGGLLYYVMPYVEGESLRQRLERERQLPVKDALRLAAEVAGALDYAHRQGLIHRDIKPENLLLADGHAVVADFGIARAIVAAGESKLTETGATLGTPLYMSPEQALGSPLDGRSDQYSLACVLYEMLSGQPPFTGATGESLVHQHLSVAPRAVSQVRRTVPPEVDRALSTALAKAAADRFATAAEFAAAIAGAAGREAQAALAVPAAPAAPAASRHPRAGRRAAVIGVTVAVVGLGAFVIVMKPGPLSGWFGGNGTVHAGKKDWILVAEFDGPAGDSSLAVTTRDLVSAALDQSEIVATVPRDQIRLALQNAGKPTDTRVDAELARELAYRSAVRAVVEGKVGRLGRGYSVVVQVVDAESLKVVLSESVTARNEDALIPALGRLAGKLRAGLGERRSAIQATRPVSEAMTPSFEAYRLVVKAVRLIDDGSSREAIPVIRDALAIDPDFATAWMVLGITFNNVGVQDSALAAYDEALRRHQRLTTTGRLFIEALRAHTAGDTRGALAAYDHLLQYNPAGPYTLNNRATVLNNLGRVEEALESIRKAEQASPFGPNQVHRINEVVFLYELGRFDEARRVTGYLQGLNGALYRMEVENAAANWAEVERVGDSLLAGPGLDESSRAEALLKVASARAARGALKTSAATYEEAEEVARGTMARPLYENAAWRARLTLAVVSAGAIPIPRDPWAGDSSAATLITRGLRAVIVGDGVAAQRLLDAARAGKRHELASEEYALALLGARITALTGRWDEAARMLGPIASRRPSAGTAFLVGGATAVRWFLADAFERLDQPDSSAAYLELALSDPASAGSEPHLRGITVPFIHRRLVLLYARTGRLEDARRHWQVFSETVRTPDPEIQPLIAEARAALASAEGMARSARR